MPIRQAFRSGTFYPDNQIEIKAFIEKNLMEYKVEDKINKVLGGIVPHAGWFYSGSTAMKVFLTLKEKFKGKIDTFIIYGAVHVGGVRKASVFTEGSWETPIGNVKIDDELADMILQFTEIDVEKNENAHRTEHSIEVQIPFIHHLFPDSKILPIMSPPKFEMIEVGKKIGTLLSKLHKNVCVIASTDLTHYGPRFMFTKGGLGQKGLEWMKANDKTLIDLMLNMKYDKILNETYKNRNACGAGAIICAMTTLEQLGAKKGSLLTYTTSYDEHPFGEPSDTVGYAGIVY